MTVFDDARDAELTYLSGVDSGGKVASPRYQTTMKWGDTVIGTASGTILYGFDTPSGWTNVEKETVNDSLALWSALANVTFSLVDDSNAKLVFSRGGSTETSGTFASPTGADGSSQAAALATVSTTFQTTLPGDTVGGSQPLGSPAFLNLLHETGHALGLGHGGPYNFVVDPMTQQFGVYDMRLWTVMSYIAEFDTAQYSSSYPVVGTDWHGTLRPSTPMPLDILALQRLYGTPTHSALDGDDVFGFNSTFTGPLAKFYQFSSTSEPIVTLFSTGTNNVLNLSGYSRGSTINLEPGTFSSANGLVNNIGIDFHTVIETAIGGTGDDTIKGNALDNRLVGSTGSNTMTGGLGVDQFSVTGHDFIMDLGAGGADVFFVGSGASLVAYLAADWTAPVNTFSLGETTLQANGHNVSVQKAYTNSGFYLHNIGNGAPVTLTGSLRSDTITGGYGDDWLDGGGGYDYLTGGEGRDRFLVRSGGAFIWDLGGTDEIVVGEAATVSGRVVADWKATGVTTNSGIVSLLVDGHSVDVSLSGSGPAAKGFTLSNNGNTAAVSLIGSLRDDVITGGSASDVIVAGGGDDRVSGKGGSDKIDLGAGTDTLRDSLADLDGDTISNFAIGDTLDIAGALIGRNNFAVAMGGSNTTVTVGGKSFQFQGDFSDGDFMSAAHGKGAEAHTTVTFQNHLLDLQEGVSVDPTTINGVANEAFLTGDGTSTFTLTLQSADSAYANTLGTYRVAADGTIKDVHVLFDNTLSVAGAARTISLGMPGVDERIGFFLIQDGFDRYGSLPDDLSFVTSGTSTTADLDDGHPPTLYSATLNALNGTPVFHSFADFNPSHFNQVLSGVTTGGRELRIGFEDQFAAAGDRDYQDVVIRIGTTADDIFVI
ncbi:hypothetical protein BH11PSE3_BH11PSE3_01010 [soil metagenome]